MNIKKNIYQVFFILFIMFSLILGKFVYFVEAKPAQKETQLLKLGLKTLTAACEVRRTIIDKQNYLMMEYQKLKDLPEDFANKIGLVNEMAVLAQKTAIPAYEELRDKVKEISEIWNNDPFQLKKLKENIEKKIEYEKEFVNSLRKANYDTILIGLTNRKEFEENYTQIVTHFQDLQKTCGDEEHGRNCWLQVANGYDQLIFEAQNRYQLLEEANQVQIVQHMDFMQKKHDEAIVAAQYATPDEYVEAMEEFKKEKPFTLNPVL